MLKLLCIVPYPTEAPSNRLRVESYFPYLRKHGVKVRKRPFMSSYFYRMRYRPGAVPQKAVSFAMSAINRLLDVRRAGQADVILVHREAFPVGGPFVERAMARMGVPIVFDFDDAIWLHSSGENPFVKFLKHPEKTASIIQLSSAVIAGNENLKAYASQYNDTIVVIPTPVDTAHFAPKPRKTDLDRVIVGWIGSNTTAPYLKMVEPALAEITRRYPHVEMRIVGGSVTPEGVARVSLRRWGLESELRDLHGFDIGIMPMPDTDWTRGKCGFKALLYMSVGVPSLCSPVGITTDIIRDGRNGFLASTTDEWIERLSLLVENPSLRREVGLAGRATVEEKYSVNAHAPRLLEVLEQAAGRRAGAQESAEHSEPVPSAASPRLEGKVNA
ncbi:MAG: glycosyltransferase family 4 protein [Chloroflexi bacterium]|nr:glycosyltransferase family 4 protein [Chloroflexota bacterium]